MFRNPVITFATIAKIISEKDHRGENCPIQDEGSILGVTLLQKLGVRYNWQAVGMRLLDLEQVDADLARWVL